MFIFYYILIPFFYLTSSLPVNDDIFEWFKDDDNILPMKEFEYIRPERNSPDDNRRPMKLYNIKQPQHYIKRKIQKLIGKNIGRNADCIFCITTPQDTKKNLARRREIDKKRRAKKKQSGIAPVGPQKTLEVRRRQYMERKMKQRPFTYETYLKEKENKKRLNDRYRAKLKANVLSGDATEQETMNRSKKKKIVATKDVDLHEM